MHELVYTSAPKGLKPGSQGFCTVACSVGMPPNLMMRLEALSGYRHLFPPGQQSGSVNPVVRSHLVVRVGGTDWHVLSRIADAGIDYTQRANKITHHIVFDTSELPPAGPAALLACESRFFCTWDDEPKLIMKPAAFPQLKPQPGICRYWERITDDAGWGGVLADTVRENRQVNLVVTPEMDAITLFEESLALLPPEIRWQTTLTTYYTRSPSGVGCRWRCIIAGSPTVLFGRSTDGTQIGLAPNAMVIDLTQPLRTPVPSPLVEAARSGKVPTAFINVRNITELSAEMGAERQPDSRQDDTASESQDSNESVETVPISKPEKKPKKRKRRKQDRFHEDRERWLNDTKEREKWGLLMLLVLGLLFIGVPALLIAAMVFAKNRDVPPR